MGSNVNNASTSGGHEEETMYNSKDIVSSTKAGQKKEYFVKVKEKSFPQRFSTWFSKHKKKILIIFCAIAIIAIAILVIIKITAAPSEPEEKTIESWGEEIDTTKSEIDKYLEELENSDSTTPLSDTISHFEELYDAETDQDKKFTLLIAQINYLIEQEDYDEAEKLSLYASIPDLSDEQLYLFAVASYNLYTEKGDEVKADYYYSITRQLAGTAEGEE